MAAISNAEEMQSAGDEEETQSTSDEEEMPQSTSDEEDSSRLSLATQDSLRQTFRLFRDLHVTNSLYEHCPEDDHRVALIVTDNGAMWKTATSRPFACIFTHPPIRNALGQSEATGNGLGPEDDHQSAQEELEKFCLKLRTEVCDEELPNIYWGFHETDNGTVHYMLSTTADLNVSDFLRSNYVPINA